MMRLVVALGVGLLAVLAIVFAWPDEHREREDVAVPGRVGSPELAEDRGVAPDSPTRPPGERTATSIEPGIPLTRLAPANAITGLYVEGLVLDGTARPIAGAAVALFLAASDGWLTDGRSSATRAAETSTGLDGRFALHTTLLGDHVLVVEHPQYPSQRLLVAARDDDHAVVELGEIVMRASLGLAVETVAAESGATLPGARIAISPVLFDPLLGAATAPRRLAITGADGRGIVYGLGEGDWRIRVEADGRASTELEYRHAASASRAGELRIALAPGCALGGRVLDPRGEALPGALVTISAEVDDGVATSVVSGRDGAFRALGLPLGPLRVRAEALAFEAIERRGVSAAGENPLVLRFAPGAALAGLVLEASSGRPLAGVQVRARPERGAPLVRAGRIAHPTAESGADGSFEIAGLPPGRFRLTFTSDRHLTLVSEALEASPDPDRSRSFAMVAAPLVELTVLDASGQPLPRAEIEMLPPDHDGTALAELLDRASGAGRRAHATSGGDGRARVALRERSGRILVRAPLHAPSLGEPIVIDPSASPLQLGSVRLARGATLVGLCLDQDGRPVPGALVEADPVGGELPRWFARVHADAAGRFRLGPLAAGDWELAFALAGPTHAREAARRFASTRTRVTLTDGQRLELELTAR